MRPTRASSRRTIATWISVSLVCTLRSSSLRALDYFEIRDTFRLAPSSQLLSTVRRIDPDLFETWVQWSESGEQAPSPFPIV